MQILALNTKAAILVLLDLSAAFETIDHEIMLTRLKDRFGITCFSHKRFESYMANRSQNNQVHGRTSAKDAVHFGVLPGSVFGPLMFNAYTYNALLVIFHVGMESKCI